MKEKVLFTKATEKLSRFNKYGLHYNMVAQGAYEKLKRADSPFLTEYRPFIIAALISFDMGRTTGSGLSKRYEFKTRRLCFKTGSENEGDPT